MAYQFYITIQGTKQGKFKGESISHGKEKWSSEALAWDFDVKSPRDAASGHASGKRQFGPIKIVPGTGAASPHIFQALFSKEALKTVQIDFVGPSSSGSETGYYTVKLTNATSPGCIGQGMGSIIPGSPG
jgi:type VI secretion system secreted protein Hcp